MGRERHRCGERQRQMGRETGTEMGRETERERQMGRETETENHPGPAPCIFQYVLYDSRKILRV